MEEVKYYEGVEEINSIKDGHYVLGENLKRIKMLEKSDVFADTSVSDYGLPKRIDFQSMLPPVIGTVSPGSISEAELHVPAGALETYATHKQWKQALVIIDGEGNMVINRTKLSYKLEKLRIKREEAEAEALQEELENQEKEKARAKQEKIMNMGDIVIKNMLPNILRRWNPKLLNEWSDELRYEVNVKGLRINLRVPKNTPVNVWPKIVAQLELIEKELS